MGAKDMMRKAHQNKATQLDTSLLANKIHRSTQETVVEPTPRSEMSQTRTFPAKKIKSAFDKIRRPGLDDSVYGVRPWLSNMQVYNRDLVHFIRNFSTENKLNGGVPITKSELLEVILEVLFYDKGLKPIGFESIEQLRAYLQNI